MQNTSRILAIDFGTKVCGFAISEPLTGNIFPLASFEYKNKDLMQVIKKIKNIIVDYDGSFPISTLVLGYPLKSGRLKTQTTLFVEQFYQLLLANFASYKIELEDESYSSNEAKVILDELEFSPTKYKEKIDQLAAYIILQRYLSKANV